MKNIKTFVLVTIAALLIYSCDEEANSFSDDPTTGWVEFTGSGSATISLITEELVLPIDVNVPVYPDGLNISYTLQPIQGDFSDIVSTDTSVFVDPFSGSRTASLTLHFSNLEALTNVVAFDVVLTSVDVLGVGIGVDENSLTTYRVSTPCPINLGTSYTGTSSSGGALVQSGYSVNLTDLGNSTYSIDGSWGDLFVDTLCGGCIGGVSAYPGPLVFSIDPATFAITVISGGEPSGVGNPFDLAYTLTGTGTYNSCDDQIQLTITENGIFNNPVTATVLLE